MTSAVPPPNELDGLLRAFFQAELPAPWPALVLPEEARRQPAPRPVFAGRSRLALAASVGLLLGGTLLLPGRFAPAPPADAAAGDPGDVPLTASDDPLLKVRTPDGKVYKLKESLLQEKDKPTQYLIEFERP